MNLDFHNMPSQHAIMEKAIQDLEASNSKLETSVASLEEVIFNLSKQIEDLRLQSK